MKKWIQALPLSLGLLLAGSASANFINGADVGNIDLLIDQTSSLGCPKGSSPSAEICWINNVLNGKDLDPTTYNHKSENVGYQFVDGSPSLIGFELSSPSEYFLIKNSTWWGLFSNQQNLDWAVIDTGDLNPGFNLPSSGWTISHVATIGGDKVAVPEPGALALLGAGLLGMGLIRRRRQH